ncbi:MAG: hypothetical protein IID48_11080 [Proteobacteria bacterium]|nr:hypothetical protein [Pseudomonadota bacterium]
MNDQDKRGRKAKIVPPIDDTSYVNKHGLQEIFPASHMTVYRLRRRPVDPFPAGQIIGGSRYWQIGLVKEWLARQGAEAA